MMENYQFWTLVGMSASGFAWLIRMNIETRKDLTEKISEVQKDIQGDIKSLDSRLSHIEGYLEGYFGNSRRSGGEK